MKKTLFAIFTLFTMLVLTGCEPQQKPYTVAETKAQKEQAQREKDAEAIKQAEVLDSYRAITIDNALTLAKDYREANPRLTGMKIVTHPDLMMTAECLQGSGWIWVSYMGEKNEKTKEVEKYKAYCSTHAQNMGCFLEKDFQETAFAGELKKCNRGIKLPHTGFKG